MRKKKKPYKPKTNLSDPQQIRKMLGSMVDKYNHGVDVGNKRIFYSNTKEKLNKLFSPITKKPKNYDSDPLSKRFYNQQLRDKNKEIHSSTLTSKKIAEHINGIKKRYYTSDPFSPIFMAGMDTDNRTPDPDRVAPFLIFFNIHFQSFHDSGSSGKSLHNFPKFNMVPLYDYYQDLLIDGKTDLSWSKYTNSILAKVSYILKTYGQTILAPEFKIVINEKTGKPKREYFVEFDAIKGTYPDYEHETYTDKSGKKCYKITKVLSFGKLIKLPNLFTPEDVLRLSEAPIYSILDLLCLCIYLVNELFLSCSVVASVYLSEDLSYNLDKGSSFSSYSSFLILSDEQAEKLLTISEELETILVAHSICFPSQEKNVVSLNLAEVGSGTQVGTEPDEVIQLEEERTYKDYVHMPGHFPVEKEEPHFQVKNKETLESINQESDVMLRSRRYLYFLYMKFALEGKELDDFEDYRHNYRADAGTGAETEKNVIRLRYVWDTSIKKMKNYVFGGLKQTVDSLEERINKAITQEEINILRDRHSSFSRNIYPRDLAGAALWIKATLTNEKYLEFKNWTATYARDLNGNKELTAPMSALVGFLNKLKEKSILKNKCDHKKAKALREILVHIGWIKCVDNTYDFTHAHRSMRYILTEKHPYYKEFEEAIGKETIEYWKNIKKQSKKKIA